MDFAILDDNKNILCFIQYNGLQHYKDTGYFGKQARQETDAMKKEYCCERKIPLFCIAYNESIQNELNKIIENVMLIPCQAA